MKVYVVEAWSNSMEICPFTGDRTHNVWCAHIASTLAAARKFCRTHGDYAGDPLKFYIYNSGYGFVPWHWRIKEVLVDEDQCCTVGWESKHIESRTRTGKLRK